MFESELSVTAAPPAPVPRPRVVVVATAFATVATLVYFAGLIGIYLQRRSTTLAANLPWLPEGVTVPLTQPNIMVLTLILSSVTVQWACRAVRNDDRQHSYLALGITLLFGFAYINMAAYLYSIMGYKIEAGPQSVLLYAVTGSHVVMVVAAMSFVVLMAFRALGGQFTSRQHDGLSAAALFWHANVLVFFIIWLAVYVTK
jgi:cytochrome c oxidase subunit 3